MGGQIRREAGHGTAHSLATYLKANAHTFLGIAHLSLAGAYLSLASAHLSVASTHLLLAPTLRQVMELASTPSLPSPVAAPRAFSIFKAYRVPSIVRREL